MKGLFEGGDDILLGGEELFVEVCVNVVEGLKLNLVADR